jgi:hypothetical protein
VILKPLPFADPDRLVGVWHVAPGLMPGAMNQSPATYLTYRDNKVFDDIGMWDNTAVTITGRGEPERVDGLMVSDGTLPVVGVRPVLGRTFTPDDRAGSAETVMISHGYRPRLWRNPGRQSVVIDGRPGGITAA